MRIAFFLLLNLNRRTHNIRLVLSSRDRAGDIPNSPTDRTERLLVQPSKPIGRAAALPLDRGFVYSPDRPQQKPSPPLFRSAHDNTTTGNQSVTEIREMRNEK